ncbi:NAD-dependent epimerase/dehydratase family protein [Tateyamaria sp.]|uniref:NAD-dependent epimerase/dehydratase family protein n=1 Tax=Tateyamaria sp. TaxID=1929288 RepID=UPI00329AA311
MRVVVLGGGGRLGKLLAPVFPRPATWLTRQDVDICNSDALRKALTGTQAVFCMAGVTPGGNAPMEANIDLARRTLDAAQDVDAGHVFLFSSAAVYGRVSGALSEDGPTAPQAPYGVAKLAMEQMAADHEHPNTVLRLGNVAGADAILGGWKPGFALDVLADGTTPQRSYIGPACLGRVLSQLCMASDLPPLMNVAAPGAVEMGELLDAAHRHWQPKVAGEGTIGQVALDTRVLERFITFDTSDSTAQGIVADWRKTTGEQ